MEGMTQQALMMSENVLRLCEVWFCGMHSTDYQEYGHLYKTTFRNRYMEHFSIYYTHALENE
jgi:hypothetical protein